MIEIDIPERTYAFLEILALLEDLTPEQLLNVMVKEWPSTDLLANLADFASPEHRANRVAILSARRAAIASIKGDAK